MVDVKMVSSIPKGALFWMSQISKHGKLKDDDGCFLIFIASKISSVLLSIIIFYLFLLVVYSLGYESLYRVSFSLNKHFKISETKKVIRKLFQFGFNPK